MALVAQGDGAHEVGGGSEDIDRAVAALREGRLVAFPTETVYGLGADAGNPEAVRRIFQVKGRPSWHPLIVHIGDAAALDTWAVEIPDEARALARACWPGALTIVVRRSTRAPDEVTGGHETIGLRVPANPVALAMLRAFGSGVAAPSANRFGRVSPTTAEHVRAELGDAVDVVLDGGPCAVGVESTIVDLSGVGLSGVGMAGPVILRPGGVARERIEAILGRSVAISRPTGAGAPAPAPGTLASHYSPAAEVELCDGTSVSARARVLVEQGLRVGVLAPGPVRGLPGEAIHLDPAGSPDSYARLLYARLREADAAGVEVLLAVPPDEVGIGVAVVDRLRRASGRPGEPREPREPG